jgi:polyisoprenyl-teichoic acid--peptidoglycan teichoic acid transferase
MGRCTLRGDLGQPRHAMPARSVALPAFLTFLWPGLGQLLQHRRRAALVFALPVIPVVVLAAWFFAGGLENAALRLLDPGFARLVLGLVLLVGAWRLIALGEHVFAAGGPARLRRADLVLVAVLAVAVVETHAIGARFAMSFYDAGTAIYDPGPTAAPNASPGATQVIPSPFETPATAESRINVLLMGIDSSSVRTHALADTLIVASVDPVTGATSMVSLPRDIAAFALYGGGTYPGKINSFANYAESHPKQYPDGGVPSLMREIGFLLGIPIQYYASVNLDGFLEVIDAMDYVRINNPRDIADPGYRGWTDNRPIGFYLTAGVHKLHAQEALAYARSRKGAGDNDFTRAARQQQLLSAVRARLTDPALLPRLPKILDAIGHTLRTNFPPDRLSEMLVLARKIDDAATRRVVLGPPYSKHPPTNTTGGTYILQLNMNRVQRLSVDLYGADSAYWTASAASSPQASPSGP